MGAWIEIPSALFAAFVDLVAPHVGAWIEIHCESVTQPIWSVAPHVGAWIEIQQAQENRTFQRSHPTWVRGLKSVRVPCPDAAVEVAPHVGAWIEIIPSDISYNDRPSHPTWVRGLKYRVGVTVVSRRGRTPRGCVD